MWLGELITDRGVGNGMSLLIFTSIIARLPRSAVGRSGQNGSDRLRSSRVIGLASSPRRLRRAGQRRIPVQYAKRMVGRKMYGGTSTYIPLKVNMAGVIPVIFASSLLYLPPAPVQPGARATWWAQWISANFGGTGDHPVYMVVYFALIIFFTYFYVAITFNPVEVADNMKKYGGFIPGIRAGKPTAEYLDYVLTRITLPGSLYLALIALIPLVAFGSSASAELPVRRHVEHPDHGRRRPRDGEADRVPAAAAHYEGFLR
jgi:preprotein translocase subunit SecY